MYFFRKKIKKTFLKSFILKIKKRKHFKFNIEKYLSEFYFLSPVYFGLAFINLKIKLYLTSNWFSGNLMSNHSSLIKFTYTNNEQSRLLQFLIPDFFHRFFIITIEDAYLLQRWLFVFAAFVVFHYFLRKWFSVLISMGGVCLLAALMPFTYMNHLQESAPLLLLTFVLALCFIRDRKPMLFALVLWFGALNNETILSLSALFFFYNIKYLRFNEIFKAGIFTFIVSVPAWTTQGIIRFITRHNNHLTDRILWHQNINGIFGDFTLNIFDWYKAEYLYIVFLFGALWFYPFFYYKKQDVFLKRSLLFIPLFIVPHFITGAIKEVRQMVPLAFIIIPMSLKSIETGIEKLNKEREGLASGRFKKIIMVLLLFLVLFFSVRYVIASDYF